MNYPRVELHCHLDGALTDDCFCRFSRELGLVDEGVSDEAWVKSHQMTSALSLYEGLKAFDFINRLLQTKAHLTEATACILDAMYERGTRLAELRFAPQLHCREEMSFEEAVEAVLAGLSLAQEKHPDLVCGILLCMMVLPDNHEANRRTVEVAKKYYGKGVIGVDLAGAELNAPCEEFDPEFALCRELGLPYTIHAGEAGPASNVRHALLQNATRIGHGVHAVTDDALVEDLAKAGTVLEVSVTSNCLSQAVDCLANHPIRKLMERGVRINVNTDDPFLFGITLPGEYEILKNAFGFTEKELIRTNLWGAQASFCKGKEAVIEALTEALANA